MVTAHSALITGAGNGIGAATAHAFAAAGRPVIVADIDDAAATRVAAEITASGGIAISQSLDVGDERSWERLRAELRLTGYMPSIVVNNAFALATAPADQLREDQWNWQLSVTLSSVYRSLRTFHDVLADSGGSIINVASVHA